MTRISRKPKIPYPHALSTSAFNLPDPHPVSTFQGAVEALQREMYTWGPKEALGYLPQRLSCSPRIHFVKLEEWLRYSKAGSASQTDSCDAADLRWVAVVSIGRR